MVDHGLAIRIAQNEAEPDPAQQVSEWPAYDEAQAPDPFAQAPSWLEG